MCTSVRSHRHTHTRSRQHADETKRQRRIKAIIILYSVAPRGLLCASSSEFIDCIAELALCFRLPRSVSPSSSVLSSSLSPFLFDLLIKVKFAKIPFRIYIYFEKSLFFWKSLSPGESAESRSSSKPQGSRIF